MILPTIEQESDDMNESVRMSVKEVSDILRVDSQTVRIMIQQGVVDWGTCFKMPNSHHYSYLISRQKFCEAFGIGGDSLG